MNDMQKVQDMEIQALAESVAEKRNICTRIGMMNANVDEVTRMQLSMEYAKAQSELTNAESDLRYALQRKNALSPIAGPRA